MAPDFGKVFEKAFKFAFSANRMLPIFILGMALVVMITGFIAFMFIPAVMSMILSYVVIGFFMLLVLALIYIFYITALVDNAKKYWKGKNVSLFKSTGVAKDRYANVIVAILITTIITMALMFIPIIGFVFAIIVSWFFIFIIPIIVVWGDDAVSSIRTGYNLFMENKLTVFLYWLILNVIVLIIVLAALIIALGSLLASIPAFGNVIIQSVNRVPSMQTFQLFLTVLQMNVVPIFIALTALVVVFTYVIVMQVGANTFMLMSLKKPNKSKK